MTLEGALELLRHRAAMQQKKAETRYRRESEEERRKGRAVNPNTKTSLLLAARKVGGRGEAAGSQGLC